MAKKYVPVFFDWKETTVDLDQAQKGNLIDAIVDYASERRTDEEIIQSLTAIERVAFRFMKGQVDRNDEISLARSKAGSSKAEQKPTSEIKQEQKETKTSKKFVPPTVDEVRAYCIERKNHVDPEAFVAHYTANGWKVGGRGAMKDWKAAIITWEKNDFSKGSGKKVAAQEYAQRDYSDRQKQAEKRFEKLL